MRIKTADYETSSVDIDHCPAATMAEFAVIGRSNVGKSSLINHLLGRKDLARVSSKPGHTRMLNFYLINKTWRLVDMPGYGYAKVSKTLREKFSELVSDYLATRTTLRCVLVLVDASLPPQQIDLEFTHWLMGQNVPFVLVFTKADKVSGARGEEHVRMFHDTMADFSDNVPMTFVTSVRNKAGHEELLAMIGQVLHKQD